jgi:hypothetical protein
VTDSQYVAKVAGHPRLGAAREIAEAHLHDALELHHRYVVVALVAGDLTAGLKALAE